MSAFEFQTREFQFSYGRRPSGRSWWAFRCKGHERPVVIDDADYRDARDTAVAEFRRRGITRGIIEVLPRIPVPKPERRYLGVLIREFPVGPGTKLGSDATTIVGYDCERADCTDAGRHNTITAALRCQGRMP